jgi:simple sugar transport system substrate-binding protein
VDGPGDRDRSTRPLIVPLQRLGPLVLVMLLACGRTDERSGQPARGTEDTPGRDEIRIVVVTHGQSSDPFWSIVSHGVRDAARDLGVRTEYQAPLRFDMVEMSERIAAATAAHPAALVVSIPDPDALGPTIRAAVERGIAVVSINSGAEAWKTLGALAHIGQTEYEAGFGAGERLAAAGARLVLCVNHEVGNAALDRRCDGLRDALGRSGGGVEVLAVDLADPVETEQRIAGALTARPEIDGVLALGPTGSIPALAALRTSGRLGATAFATFDLSPEVLAAIRNGHMLFAVDQQPYLQGYLPVVLLVKHLETGVMPGGGDVIRTGPGFVTREDVERVIDLSERGLR